MPWFPNRIATGVPRSWTWVPRERTCSTSARSREARDASFLGPNWSPKWMKTWWKHWWNMLLNCFVKKLVGKVPEPVKWVQSVLLLVGMMIRKGKASARWFRWWWISVFRTFPFSRLIHTLYFDLFRYHYLVPNMATWRCMGSVAQFRWLWGMASSHAEYSLATCGACDTCVPRPILIVYE